MSDENQRNDKKADSLEDAIEQLNQQQAQENEGKSADANDATGNMAELQSELEKVKKDYLYLRADFDNFKKSAIKERSDLIKYGSERLIMELLNVLDNFDKALETELTSDNIESFRKGIEMIWVDLTSSLSKFGVTPVDVKGKPFDPTLHEALSTEPTTETPEGHITQVFKKAYKMHDKIIRPAQVVVATKPAENNETDTGSEDEGSTEE